VDKMRWNNLRWIGHIQQYKETKKALVMRIEKIAVDGAKIVVKCKRQDGP